MLEQNKNLIYYGLIDGLRVYGNKKTKKLEIHLYGDIFGDILKDWKKKNKKTLKKLKGDLICLTEEI